MALLEELDITESGQDRVAIIREINARLRAIENAHNRLYRYGYIRSQTFTGNGRYPYWVPFDDWEVEGLVIWPNNITGGTQTYTFYVNGVAGTPIIINAAVIHYVPFPAPVEVQAGVGVEVEISGLGGNGVTLIQQRARRIADVGEF